MTMSSALHVSVTDELRSLVEQRVKEGRFSTPSEYIRQLIRDDLKRAEEERLQQLLLEGLDSGAGRVFNKDDWNEMRKNLVARVERKKHKKA